MLITPEERAKNEERAKKFIEKLYNYTKEDLKRNKINDVKLLCEKTISPVLLIIYKSGYEKVIDGVDDIEKFLKTLK